MSTTARDEPHRGGARRRVAGRRPVHRGALVAAVAVIAVVAVLAGSGGAHGAAGTRPTDRAGATSRFVTAQSSATAPQQDAEPVAPGTEVPAGIDESDPFLTVADGRYVLITSGGRVPEPTNVPLVTSTDFVHWSAPVDALPVLPGWASPGYTWAPDLHRFGSGYALYFTASLANRTPQTECIGSAFAATAGGPFTASPSPLICQLDQGGSIDPRVFVDRDGTAWMLWKSDQNIGGAVTPTKMWSQQLSADGTHLLGAPSLLLSPDRAWQGSVVEAPDMVDVDGTYWVVYSANWYNQPDYAIGVARCTGPAGPCTDTAPGPLLASNLQGAGPGEASVFDDGAGVWMLYSARRSLAPYPDVPPRPVYITRLGFGAAGPYLADGPLPTATDLLQVPLWSPTP